MLGENIRNLREERGLTQKDVVEKARELKGSTGTFTQPQLSKWEKMKLRHQMTILNY